MRENMKRMKFLACALLLVGLLACPVLAAAPVDAIQAPVPEDGTVISALHFTDQGSIQHSEAVNGCVDCNIINGYGDGSFRPDGNITRAEMCKMVCVALNGGRLPATGASSNVFTDVSSNHWAQFYISYCCDRKIVGGMGGGRFAPDDSVTVIQAAKMLLVPMGYNADRYVGSDWAYGIQVDALDAGLYDGLTSSSENAPLTRDNAAQMIWNALNARTVKYNVVGSNLVLEHLDVTLMEKCYGSAPGQPSQPGRSMALADYVGMSKAEFLQTWGSDCIEELGGEMGAESTLYYEDFRIPAEFSLNDGVVSLVFCFPSAIGNGFTLTNVITGTETYSDLLQKGITGTFVTEDNDPEGNLGWNYAETAAFSCTHAGKFFYFSWLDTDPYTTPANFIFIG